MKMRFRRERKGPGRANAEYGTFFFLLVHGFSPSWPEKRGKRIIRIITNGRVSVTGVKPDDCHVSGGEVHGPGVLILEVSATCSWEEKVIPFASLAGD